MSVRRLWFTKLGLALALVAALAILAPMVGFAATKSGYQILRNMGSAKCLDDTGWSRSQGVQMQQWTCGSPQQDNQIWNLNYVGGSGGTSWLIQNKYSGMCLDVYQAKYQNGTPIVQWPCDGSDLAQQFVPISSGNPCTGGTFYDFKAYAASAYTIEVYGQSNTNGAKVDLWSDWGGLYQTWYNCASPSLPVG